MQACLNVFSLNKNYQVFLNDLKNFIYLKKMLKLLKITYKEIKTLVNFLKCEFQIFA